MSEWVSVSDQLPRSGDAVLVTDGERVTAGEFDPQEWKKNHPWRAHMVDGYEWDWDFDGAAITHWMPLPEPPTR